MSAILDAHPTSHWHRLDDGRVQCDVCPRACRLREGQRGLCFVRARQDDAVVLTTYGRSSGFCVDPIEKKPLNHFLPGSAVLSFGTAGCNLACRFCQNWDISKSREIDVAGRRRLARGDRRGRGPLQLPERGVHLQRSRDLHGVRDRRCRCVPRPRRQVRRGDRRVHEPRAARRVLPPHGRGERRPEGVHRGLLPRHLRRPPRARARDTRVPEARDRRLVRDHDAAHPGPQRLRPPRSTRRRAGSPSTSGRTCRCISRPFTPTGRCSTGRPRRLKR